MTASGFILEPRMFRRKIKQGTNLIQTAVHEVGSHLVAFNLYPLGFLNENASKNPHPKHSRHPRPVLLVHGIVHNRSAFIAFRRRLESEGWENVYTLNYSTRHGSITRMVEELAWKVEEILEKTHSSQIDIIAHSLGGIVARYYMTFGEGRGKVKNLITLGTPHQGTHKSVLLKPFTGGSISADLRHNSYLLRSLNQTALARDSKITSIYSAKDWVAGDENNCMVTGTPANAYRNIAFDHVGHLGLLYKQEVYDSVIHAITADELSMNSTQFSRFTHNHQSP